LFCVIQHFASHHCENKAWERTVIIMWVIIVLRVYHLMTELCSA